MSQAVSRTGQGFEQWGVGARAHHTVEEVKSKEWRQEDASRKHPQGLVGVRGLEVEPRPVGGGMM